MKTLKEIFEDVQGQIQGQKISEFPKHNFSVTFLEKQGIMTFDPIHGNNLSSKGRSIMSQIKQKFNISSLKAKDMGSFEIQITNPKEYLKVVDFIQQSVGEEKVYEN